MTKRIAVCSSGSRGDTQPYIALCLELMKRGHEVYLCTEERMKPLAEEYGVAYRRIAGDPTCVLWEKESQEMLRDGKIMKVMKKMEEVTAPTWLEAANDYENACKDADIIVTGALCISQTYSVAEKYKIPWVPVILGAIRSGEFPLPFIAHNSLGFKFLNRFTWNLIYYGLWFSEKKRVNPWRINQLKLPPIQDSMGVCTTLFENANFPSILAINRGVIPGEKRPADWPEHFKVTGFFFVPDTPEDEVDERIRSFLENEPEKPPVYLGFGSMPAPNPLLLVKMAIGLVEKLNIRAILCAGWSDLSNGVNPSPTNLVTPEDAPHSDDKLTLPPNLMLIKSVSHAYLFPRCSVVVHHCGIGTTAATLRAGTPSVCCPVMLDQPGNADVLMKIGVAPAPIPFHNLHLEILVAAVRCALKKESFKEKAKYWASEIEKENGVSDAADIVLNLPKQWPGQQ